MPGGQGKDVARVVGIHERPIRKRKRAQAAHAGAVRAARDAGIDLRDKRGHGGRTGNHQVQLGKFRRQRLEGGEQRELVLLRIEAAVAGHHERIRRQAVLRAEGRAVSAREPFRIDAIPEMMDAVVPQ